MIRSFRCPETARIFQGGRSRKFPPEIQGRAQAKLQFLDAAVSLDDLRSWPALRLHRLSGDRAGQWSIAINDQWRICFLWEEGAADVEITDYH